MKKTYLFIVVALLTGCGQTSGTGTAKADTEAAAVDTKAAEADSGSYDFSNEAFGKDQLCGRTRSLACQEESREKYPQSHFYRSVRAYCRRRFFPDKSRCNRLEEKRFY